MCLNVHRSAAKENVERQVNEEEFLALGMPGKKHTDGAYTYMATWESGCRTLTGCLGALDKLIEYSVGIAR